MSQLLHDDDNDDANPIAISGVFSENTQAKNAGFRHFLLSCPIIQRDLYLICSLRMLSVWFRPKFCCKYRINSFPTK